MSKPCLPLERKRKISETEVICFDDIENLDAATYLSRVAAEASRLPEILQAADDGSTKTVVATTTTTVAAAAARTREPPQRPIVTTGSAASALYLVSHRTALYPLPSVDHLPKAPRQWRDTALTNFVKLRSFLHEACVKPTVRLPVPPMKDRGGWHVFCVGNDAASGNPGGYFADTNYDDDDSSEEEDDDEDDDSDEDQSATAAAATAAAVVVPEWRRSLPTDGYTPTVPLLLQMDQVMIRAVLHHLAHFVTTGFRLHENLAGWIYALLARLEQPLHRDEAVMLYALLKRLTIVRKSTTIPAATNTGDSSSVDELAACNLLILILVAYFEQGDSSALEVVEH
jgi:gem associated protein 2